MTKICIICSKEFSEKPCISKKTWETRTKLCSKECHNELQRRRPGPTAGTRKSYAGAAHWNWQGGVTALNHKVRNSMEYKLWRKSVFERDNYTCQMCGQYSGRLQVDHIKPFSIYPELRFDIDNGRVLCLNCHRATPTFGRPRKDLTKVFGS